MQWKISDSFCAGFITVGAGMRFSPLSEKPNSLLFRGRTYIAGVGVRRWYRWTLGMERACDSGGWLCLQGSFSWEERVYQCGMVYDALVEQLSLISEEWRKRTRMKCVVNLMQSYAVGQSMEWHIVANLGFIRVKSNFNDNKQK